MATTVLDIRPDQFAKGSAALLLWRICASDRCPGLINGEARLCEAFHSEALDVLTREAELHKAKLEREAAEAATRG